MTQAADSTLVVTATMPYVTIRMAAAMCGLSPAAIEKKISIGMWLEGREYRRGEDGRVEVSVEGFAAWVERGSCVQTPETAKSAPAAPMATALYRHFATDGSLLYVGISLSPIMRLSAHAGRSNWSSDIASVTVTWWSSRAAALEAEREAIKAEAPRHNIVHARGSD